MRREASSLGIGQALSLALLCTAAPALLHAAAIAPTNLPISFCDDTVTGDLFLANSMLINTDTDCMSVVTQAGGPDLCLMRYHSVNINQFGFLTTTGARPLVLTSLLD